MQPWLDLRRLRYFRAIAEHGSFSAASRALFIAQPALSHHMRELEREVGGRLFERSRNGVRTTEAGDLLLTRARVILEEVARTEEAIRQLRYRQLASPQTVRLAMIPSLASALTPELLAAAATMLPCVNLHIIEATTLDSHDLIESNKIELAINLADDRWPVGEPLVWEELLFVAVPSLGRLAAPTIRFKDLVREPLVLPSRGKPVRTCIEKISDPLGLRLNVALEIDGLSPRKKAVLAGLAGTLLPIVNIVEECSAGLLVAREVVEPPISRLIVMEKRPGFEEEVARAFRDLLIPVLERITGQGPHRPSCLTRTTNRSPPVGMRAPRSA
jgi:LysR family transcriptional regulator, nitrogen assimilation regulatory protein